jgi:DNA-binding protein HU-beta
LDAGVAHGFLLRLALPWPKPASRVSVSEDEVNKAELIDALAERLGDKKTAAAAVDNLVDVVVRSVQKGEKVTITGFGVFEKRARAARTARNPRTGEAVRVKKTSVPAFRAGTNFKEVVSGAKKLPRATSTAQQAKRAAAGPSRNRPSADGASGTRAAASRAATGRAAGSAATRTAAARSTAARSAGAAKTGPASATKAGTTKSSPAKAGAAKPVATRSGQAKTSPAQAGATRSGQAKAGQAKAGQAKSSTAKAPAKSATSAGTKSATSSGKKAVRKPGKS